MHKSISKMEDSKKLSTDLLCKSIDSRSESLPKYPYSAIITGCEKTEFVLDLLESAYAGVFQNIVIPCPTIHWNKAYKNRSWIGDIRKRQKYNYS